MDVLAKCRQCLNPCVQRNRWGNATVKTFSFFECVMPSFGGLNDYRIEDLLDSIVKLAKDVARNKIGLEIRQGSINRNRGEWFELLLFNAMWNEIQDFNSKHDISLQVIRLPSSRKGRRFWNLFIEDISRDLENLKIFIANPDFIVVDYEPLHIPSKSLLESFKNDYQRYFGKLQIDNLVGILSAKTTTRPDRRYICVHEAEVIRAMFLRHNSFAPYIVLGLDLTDADKIVLKSPSALEIIDPTYRDELIPLISSIRDIVTLADASRVISDIENAYLEIIQRQSLSPEEKRIAWYKLLKR